MKKVILISFLTIQTIFSQSEKRYISKYFNFELNKTEHLFANDVKFRESPDLNSKVIKLLKIDTPISIIEKTDKVLDFDGIKSNWYKVSVDGKIGYVLEALISVYNFKTDTSKFKFQVKENEKEEFFLKIRVLTGNEFEQYEYKLIGDEFSIQFTNNQGLNNLDNMIIVDYLAEACGVEDGNTYIFWNNGKLFHIANLSSEHDADAYYYSSSFIFPRNPGGIKNKIIYKSETEMLEDEETNWRKQSTETRELIWDGEKIIPNLKEEKFD